MNQEKPDVPATPATQAAETKPLINKEDVDKVIAKDAQEKSADAPKTKVITKCPECGSEDLEEYPTYIKCKTCHKNFAKAE